MHRPLILATALLAAALPAHAQDAGERVFRQCRACHQVGEAARNGIGPTLNGLFGRHAGTVPGYVYSSANAESDITWSPEMFAAYIRDPKARMPGTKMAFAGLRTDEEIASLTAYLQQFGADGKKPAP